MENIDPYRAQVQRSRSQSHLVRLTGVVPLLKNEIRKKVAHPWTIKCTSFKFKRSKVKFTRLIKAETESVSLTNFKLGRRLEHALSTAMAIKACEIRLLHAGWGIPCQPHPSATQLAALISLQMTMISILSLQRFDRQQLSIL